MTLRLVMTLARLFRLRHAGNALRWHPIDVLVRCGLSVAVTVGRIDGAEAQRAAAAIAELPLQHDQRERPHDQIENGEYDGDGIVVGGKPANDADKIEQNGSGFDGQCLEFYAFCGYIVISNASRSMEQELED